MDTFKSYKDFKDKILEHLTKLNKEPYGVFPGNGKPYGHIVRIPPGASQVEVIKTIIKNDGVDPDMFTEPHRFAHHLNSSQVVCYEFFRNLLTDKGRPSGELLLFLERIGVPSSLFADGYSRFEWVPNQEENTNFDFFIQKTEPIVGFNENVPRAYFEIKYTEQGFGKCDMDDKHRDKFERIYLPMLENCPCLKTKIGKDDFLAFREYYQLFRNTLRITKANWQNEYVVFLFPRENTIAQKHFEEFYYKYIDAHYRDHVLGVHWEDLTNDMYMSERFRNKFFFYTK